jgi:pseudaminic acid synthase
MGKTFIIAEMSANHNHRKDIAIETIKAAKKAGADAIKIQTYSSETETIDCEKPDFRVGKGLWDGETYFSLYRKADTPFEWHEELYHVAKEEGLICFTTPTDKETIDFVEAFGNPIYKIASFDIIDIPFIRYAASKHKPMIVATGIATEEEIKEAVDAMRAEGNNDITLLKCTSAYPATIEQANLLTMPDMKERFGVKVGVSDHTPGSLVPMTAVALGAEVVEKHFIIDRSIGGPDAAFSMDFNEFSQMVKDVRNVEKALGNVIYPTDSERITGRINCRSLYVVKDMKAGDIITAENVRAIRPGLGAPIKYLSQIIGKRVNRDLEYGDRFSMDFLQ